MPDEDMAPYLAPGEFIDSDDPGVREFARRVAANAADPAEAARRLYRAVRDEIVYDPYVDYTVHDTFRASACLRAGRGFCVGKAALMAAAARALGIPARVGFADVRNHLASRRLLELVGTDEFVYHGYAELFLDGRWVKATPTFNLSLCEKFGVRPLEFDGRHDAILHPFDALGRRHMEYLREHGPATDVPADEIIVAFRARYPRLCVPGGVGGAMAQEAPAGKG
jgi:transglutaminase-like putative cysteine protease